MAGKCVVFVTCSSPAEARRIARSAVGKRLAACATIFTGSVLSIYRWKGKVERARERLVILKTTRAQIARLEAEVHRLHSYDVPEIIVLPVVAGSHAYLNWIAKNVK